MSKKQTRYALIPHPGCVCKQCLTIASYGLHYTHKNFSPHGKKNIDCECKLMSGIPGETKFEGYGEDDIKKILSRLDTARSVIDERLLENEVKAVEPILQSYVYGDVLIGVERIADELYDMSRSEIIDDEESIQATLTTLYSSRKRNGYEPYRKYVESFATKAPIWVDDGTNLYGKELQAASWFSKIGKSVYFRNADNLKDSVNLTTDCRIDGELFDMKRIKSKNPSKIWNRVTEKTEKQGRDYIVDLSAGVISIEDALYQCNALIKKDKADRIMLIINRTLYMVEKKNW